MRNATMPALTLGAFAPRLTAAFCPWHDRTDGTARAMRAPRNTATLTWL